MRKAGSRTTVPSPEVKSCLRTAQPLVFGVKTGEGSQLHRRAPPPHLRGAQRRRGRCWPARAPAGGGGVRGTGLGGGEQRAGSGVDTGPLGRGGGTRPRSLPEPLPRVWGCVPVPPDPPSQAEGDHRPLPGRAGRAFVLLPRRPPRRLSSQAWGAFPQPRVPISQCGLVAPWTRRPGRRGGWGSGRAPAPRSSPRARPSLPPPRFSAPRPQGTPPPPAPAFQTLPPRVQRRGLADRCSEFREHRPVPLQGPRPSRYPSQRRPSRACPGIDAGGPAFRGLRRDPGRPAANLPGSSGHSAGPGTGRWGCPAGFALGNSAHPLLPKGEEAVPRFFSFLFFFKA